MSDSASIVKHVCNALASIFLHLANKPLCKLIGHPLPPLCALLSAYSIIGCCVIPSDSPLREPFWHTRGLLSGGLRWLLSWADSLLYLSDEPVTDFMPRQRHATQIRGQEVRANYAARVALCAVTGLRPDQMWRFLSCSDSHAIMAGAFMRLSLSHLGFYVGYQPVCVHRLSPQQWL